MDSPQNGERKGGRGPGGSFHFPFPVLRAFNLKQLRYYGAAASQRRVAAGNNPINPRASERSTLPPSPCSTSSPRSPPCTEVSGLPSAQLTAQPLPPSPIIFLASHKCASWLDDRRDLFPRRGEGKSGRGERSQRWTFAACGSFGLVVLWLGRQLGGSRGRADTEASASHSRQVLLVKSGTPAGRLTLVLKAFDSGPIIGTLLTSLSWVSYSGATESLRVTPSQAGFLGARPSIYFLPLWRLGSEDIGSVKLMKVCL